MVWLVLVLAGCGRVAFDTATDAAASGPRCTTETFDTGLPTAWGTWTTTDGVSADIFNAQVEITVAPNLDGDAGTGMLAAFDFTGGTMTVAATPQPSGPRGTMFFSLGIDTPTVDGYSMTYENATLYFVRR